jgi:transposase/predicted nucleic acid-binding Zn finger protein
MSEREQKALVIAARSNVAKKGNVWHVPSQSNHGHYVVGSDLQDCTCPDYLKRQLPCKHILATEIVVERERSVTQTSDGQTTTTIVTETVKLRYKQVWPAYNSAQTNEKARLQSLLYELCAGIDEPIQTMGRPRLSIADMLFASTFKVYSTMSARRFMSDLKDAHTKHYLARLPHYNSIIGYLETPELTPYLMRLITESSLPLKSIETDFAVDASGFSTATYSRWFSAKYGKEMDQHDWIKVHLMCGVKTNIVTSVEITGAHVHDTKMFAPLVNSTAKHFNVEEVSADKAYSSRDNLRVAENKGIKPYIDFKKNTKPTGKVDIWHRMFHYYQMNQGEFMQHYHKRSNVESTFSMIKAKFGGYLRSKTFTAQANEALCKILCHNLCCLIQSAYELGTEATFWETK